MYLTRQRITKHVFTLVINNCGRRSKEEKTNSQSHTHTFCTKTRHHDITF